MDHIGEVIKELGKNSTLEKINLHRTKCSKLISEVISPALKDLVKDVHGKKYAILADESTDLTSCKNLALMIRYYSTKVQLENPLLQLEML